MRKRLLRHKEGKPGRQSNPHALIPGEREGDQWYVSVGWHKGESLLAYIAPVFVARNFRRQLFFIKQDESVVRNNVYFWITPPMQPPEEKRQAIHFQIHMPDKGFCASVPYMVHLLMSEHHKEVAECTRLG